ncbi:MAG TPA: hypothetical protein VFT99_23330 [Roseiflexaceae bacterium]|nr:hypothetical protein [Roseiflexaceae bacterium]
MKAAVHLHWPLVVGLGSLALVRPFVAISGLLDAIGRPLGSLLVTALISFVWIIVVAALRVRRPILTLTCSGVVYGLVALAVNAILSPLLDGERRGPSTHLVAAASVILVNALWGVLAGTAALALLAATRPAQPKTNQPLYTLHSKEYENDDRT